jgi:hypothetical protein
MQPFDHPDHPEPQQQQPETVPEERAPGVASDRCARSAASRMLTKFLRWSA